MIMNGESKEGEYNYKGGRTSLSTRGRRALAPFSPYIKAVNDAKKNPWSLANPDGYFVVPLSAFFVIICFVHSYRGSVKIRFRDSFETIF